MTTEPRQQWIVTADGRRACLFSCRTTPGGEVHLEQVRTLENRHEEEHERGRPSLLGGAERRRAIGHASAHATPHAASYGHEAEEEQRRFAREVSAWVGRAIGEVGADRLSVFAPPRFLGLLRAEFRGPGPLTDRVDLREGDLTNLSPGDLSAHPAVLEAVAGRRKARAT